MSKTIEQIHSQVYTTQAEVFEIYERPLYTREIPMKYENGYNARDHHGKKIMIHVQCASTDEGAIASNDENGNIMMIRCNKNEPEAVQVLNEDGKPLLGWRMMN